MNNSDKPQTEFEKAGEENELSFLEELLVFLKENKKWWLLPILLALALVGIFVVLTSTGAAPFIYTLF